MPKSNFKKRRPIVRVLDVIGRRWALRILWELRDGPLSFRALRTAADEISPSVLNTRLAELRDLGVVEMGDAGYCLTPAGRELGDLLMDLDRWAKAHG